MVCSPLTCAFTIRQWCQFLQYTDQSAGDPVCQGCQKGELWGAGGGGNVTAGICSDRSCDGRPPDCSWMSGQLACQENLMRWSSVTQAYFWHMVTGTAEKNTHTRINIHAVRWLQEAQFSDVQEKKHVWFIFSLNGVVTWRAKVSSFIYFYI